jgi:hypothetical protein
MLTLGDTLLNAKKKRYTYKYENTLSDFCCYNLLTLRIV